MLALEGSGLIHSPMYSVRNLFMLRCFCSLSGMEHLCVACVSSACSYSSRAGLLARTPSTSLRINLRFRPGSTPRMQAIRSLSRQAPTSKTSIFWPKQSLFSAPGVPPSQSSTAARAVRSSASPTLKAVPAFSPASPSAAARSSAATRPSRVPSLSAPAPPSSITS